MADSDNSSCEARKISLVNGYVVYTRAKRCLDSSNTFSDNNVEEVKRFKTCSDEVVEVNSEQFPLKMEKKGTDTACSEVSKVRTFKRFTRSALKANISKNGDEEPVMNEVPEVKKLKRFTRSALKANVIENGMDNECNEMKSEVREVRTLKRFTRSSLKANVDNDDEGPVVKVTLKRFTRAALKANVTEEPVINKMNEVSEAVVKSSSKRFMRSALKANGDEEPVINKMNEVSEVVVKSSSKRFTGSALKADGDEEPVINKMNEVSEAVVNSSSKWFMRSALKANGDEEPVINKMNEVSEAVVNSSSKWFMRSALKANGDEEPVINKVNEVSEVVVKSSSERFTGSALKANGDEEPMINKMNEVSEAAVKTTLKRFTRSALKSNVAEKCGDDDEIGCDGGTKGSGEGEGRRNKMEMKMSKKIVVNRMPMTVKELLDTGLLDGVAVVYMGGIKKASGLRGVIRDGGILCTCCLCNERRVITPGQFEIHACKQYRRAAQYICLQNGKSLLDLLRECRGVPLHTLEATVQNIVSSPPEEKYFNCKRCKGCLPHSCLERVGPICRSCVESKTSQDSSNVAVGRRVRSPRPVAVSSPFSASDLSISSQITRHWKKGTRSSKQVSSSNSSKRASVPILSRKKILQKMKEKSLSARLKTTEVNSNSKCLSSQNKSEWKITKKDQRLHKLVFGKDGLPDGTEVAYYARGKKLLQGFKSGSRIACGCCNTRISPSQFEVHAGCASRKKPYAYIYTSNGVSLHELAVSLSKDRKYSAKDNDNLCLVCHDGGNLLLCDGCPRAFHKECASLSNIPHGDWYCQFCENMFQREKFVAYNANAVAAGRVEGVDPIEQITNRCIRIVKDFEVELSACALCRGVDFSKSGFGPRTIIICDQCEKEYHVGCLRDHKMAYLKELPKGNWLCCNDCSKTRYTLENLLVGPAERLPESLLDTMKKKHGEKGLESLNDIDVSWRLLSGKIASSETRPLLLEAVSIFHECFDPIVDATSGRDLISAMAYGRKAWGQDFGGMYCALLTVNSSVVSAGMLRIFGTDIAELPLVATSKGNQGKGYFQTLFSCIERLLAFLNVKTLVLPAAEEAESIWTAKFGFSKMNPDQLTSYRKNFHQIVTFHGTNMLHKMVPPCRIIKKQ
ncbi:hypothetical protein RIF29_39867 [Crotalaria pallida]|uniref:PHD-type domain-containing protein n=1 Tax=Crotalaria pallida TaxID=3830 RepID=A0AAN9E4H2_CROPI